MPPDSYPPVTARPATESDGPHVPGAWIVYQGGSWLAVCPNEMAARIIAERLNEWFNRR